MASSIRSQPRARLGTVLNRKDWEDRRSNSTSSSINSRGSLDQNSRGSFDPENEALESTQPVNSPRPYYNDQAALKTATATESEHDSNTGDYSIEIGRGGRHWQGDLLDSRNEDSFHSSTAKLGDSRVLSPPPRSRLGRSPVTADKHQSRSLRQDAQIRMASTASQKENRDPAQQPFKSFKNSGASSRLKRKTLGEINARASERYDGSLLNDDRPMPTAAATKTTRFNHSKAKTSHQYMPEHAVSTVNNTAEVEQSYILPDLPNMSQLVPRTVHGGMAARSNFIAHPALPHMTGGPAYKSIDVVPIPDDEKAIFVSLNLLQGKINGLESAAEDFQRTIDELKTKNLVLKAEKRDLRTENERLRKDILDLRQSPAEKDLGRSTAKQARDRVPLQKQKQAMTSAQVSKQLSNMLKDYRDDDLFSLTPTETSKSRPTSAPPQGGNADDYKISTRRGSHGKSNPAAASSRPGKRVVIEDTNTNTGQSRSRNLVRGQATELTYLTDQPASEHLFNLRSMLEVERAKSKIHSDGKATAAGPSRLGDDTVDVTQPTTSTRPLLPRKSSMKDGSQRNMQVEDRAATATLTKTTNDHDVSENVNERISQRLQHPTRRNSDPTLTAASNISRRRSRVVEADDENMTSAFIIPDITTAQPAAAAAAAKIPGPVADLTLNDAAQQVIHSIQPHAASNCIICSRLTNINPPPTDTTVPEGHPKKTITVPIPTPISSIPIPPSADNPDPTLRPAQPPSLALAIVLKELTDQLTHLRARLASSQSRYNRTDPRLSRAQRGRLRRQMEALQNQCETVADMIYRLYDVVEAQNGASNGGGGVGGGWEMAQEEVEVTVAGLREVARKGNVRETRGTFVGDADGEEDDDEEEEEGEEGEGIEDENNADVDVDVDADGEGREGREGDVEGETE